MVGWRFTLIVAFGVEALCSPIGVEAQQEQQKISKVGYLSNSSSEGPYDRVFLESLRDLASKDGRTILFEARYAGARSEQLPGMARDLVSRGVDVIALLSLALNCNSPALFSRNGSPRTDTSR